MKKYLYLFLSLNLILTNSYFFNFFKPKINIRHKEIKKNIKYSLSNYNKKILQKINGFYGIIGPDTEINNNTNIGDYFISDGIIQGIFFNNGNITLIKKYIRTNKFIYEEKYGKVPNNKFLKLLFEMFSMLKLLPSLQDVSNTALIKINKYIYSLYERDLPYKLDINIGEHEINTFGKHNIKNIKHFSAHSKFHNNTIETIDYDFLTYSLKYVLLDSNFNILKTKFIKTENFPLIHDFFVLKDKIFFLDSPLYIDFSNMHSSIPIKLDNKKGSEINIIDKTTMNIEKYHLNESIFLFHYANIEENTTHYNIFAPVYDNIDFNKFNISGKYRNIVINKKNKNVYLEKNRELENLNLDFPILHNKFTILVKKTNNVNNGLIICNKLKIIKKIDYPNNIICGEPAIIKINNSSYLIFIIKNIISNTDSKIVLMDLKNFHTIEIPLGTQIISGFHSIFFNNNL